MSLWAEVLAELGREPATGPLLLALAAWVLAAGVGRLRKWREP